MDVHNDSPTPTALGKILHRSVRENDRGGCLEALDSGADANWVNPSTSTSALHIACKLGHTKLALLLIQRGADVNAQTKSGWIPMHFAVNTGLLELVELLHSYGGRADIVNEWMKTPLDIAKERKNEEMLEILKKRPGAIAVPVTPPVKKATASKLQDNNARSHSSPGDVTEASRRVEKGSNASMSSSMRGGIGKSPRRDKADTIIAPTEEAPLPPLSKPLPQTPSEDGQVPKGRSIRNTAEYKKDGDIARLNKEVAELRADVSFLKNELARVLSMLQQTDL